MTISLTWIIAHLIHAAGQSNIDLCWAFYCCIESLVIGHCKHNFYIFIYSKPSLFKPFPRNQLATKAQSFPRKSSNTASPMIARHARDFTWNCGCTNSPPLTHGDQIPHPLEDSYNQIPSCPGGQRCQMHGVCPGGGGGMLKLRFDRYINRAWKVHSWSTLSMNSIMWHYSWSWCFGAFFW